MKILRVWWDLVGPNNGFVGATLFVLHVVVGIAIVMFFLA